MNDIKKLPNQNTLVLQYLKKGTLYRANPKFKNIEASQRYLKGKFLQ